MMKERVMKKVVEEGDYNQIKDIEAKIRRDDEIYREKKGRKFIWMLVGFFLFGIAGWFIMPVLH